MQFIPGGSGSVQGGGGGFGGKGVAGGCSGGGDLGGATGGLGVLGGRKQPTSRPHSWQGASLHVSPVHHVAHFILAAFDSWPLCAQPCSTPHNKQASCWHVNEVHQFAQLPADVRAASFAAFTQPAWH
eukprot:1640949-Prymnesium_polylepis.1